MRPGVAWQLIAAGIHDTAAIAKKTGIHEPMIYRMWIAHRERAHRKRERDKLRILERGPI